MAEKMIVLTKPETNKKYKKLSKDVTEILQEFGANPLTEAAVELTFLAEIDDQNLEKAMPHIKKYADAQGFEIEVVDGGSE